MRILAIVVGATLLFQGDAEAALAEIIGEPHSATSTTTRTGYCIRSPSATFPSNWMPLSSHYFNLLYEIRSFGGNLVESSWHLESQK